MKMSIENLKSAVATYVDSNKISVSTFAETHANFVGLLDKIGKIFTIDSSIYDKLPELDGEDLNLGKAVEEWSLDMTLPVDFDEDNDGNKALKNYTPTARPVSYSFSFGRKILPTSIPYGNVERAVNNESEFVEIISNITKKLEDSNSAWKYQCKRELLGEFLTKLEAQYTGATTYTASTTALVVGSTYKSSGKYAVAMKSQDASASTFSQLLADGTLIELDTQVEVAIPEDETTSEAFIKAVKIEVEKASDIVEGKSLNGNTLGAENGLMLYVKQGVMPVVEVEAIAGAFQKEALAMPVEIKVIKDFGNYSGKAYAVLVDKRAVRLFKGYDATREQANGYGDRLNIFKHVEYTGHVSRNAFITEFVDD